LKPVAPVARVSPARRSRKPEIVRYTTPSTCVSAAGFVASRNGGDCGERHNLVGVALLAAHAQKSVLEVAALQGTKGPQRGMHRSRRSRDAGNIE
jgi:hypothetical protein